MKIPKIIHQLWVGQLPRPEKWMKTWREKHPGWEYVLWDEKKIKSRKWLNQVEIDFYWRRKIWHGVADLCRYEILAEYGGFYPGADTICLNPIDELFVDDEFDAYTLYENEKKRPGLLCPLHACTAGNEFAKSLVDGVIDIMELKTPWKTTGNQYVVRMLEKTKYPRLKIWPSHYFIPEHFTGEKYTGAEKVYATHEFGTTRGLYKNMV